MKVIIMKLHLEAYFFPEIEKLKFQFSKREILREKLSTKRLRKWLNVKVHFANQINLSFARSARSLFPTTLLFDHCIVVCSNRSHVSLFHLK